MRVYGKRHNGKQFSSHHRGASSSATRRAAFPLAVTSPPTIWISTSSCCWYLMHASFTRAWLLTNDARLLSPMNNDVVVTQGGFGWRVKSSGSPFVPRCRASLLCPVYPRGNCSMHHVTPKTQLIFFFLNGELKMIWNQFNMNVSPQSTAFNNFFFCITGDNFTSERTCPRWRKPWSALIPIQLTSVLFCPHHPEVKQLHTRAGLVIHHILLWLMSFFTSLSALINTENWLILSKDFLSYTSCTSMHTCEVFLPGSFF